MNKTVIRRLCIGKCNSTPKPGPKNRETKTSNTNRITNKIKHVDHPYAKPPLPPILRNENSSYLMPSSSKSIEENTITEELHRGENNLAHVVYIACDTNLANEAVLGDVSYVEDELPTLVEPEKKSNKKKIDIGNIKISLSKEEFQRLIETTVNGFTEFDLELGPERVVLAFNVLTQLIKTNCLGEWAEGRNIFNGHIVKHLSEFNSSMHGLLTNADTIKSLSKYLEIIFCNIKGFTERDRSFCCAEFLRRFSLSLRNFLMKPFVSKALENKTEIIKMQPIDNKITKEEEILYYVAGSTINSIKNWVPQNVEYVPLFGFKGGISDSQPSKKIAAMIDWTSRMNKGGLFFVNETTFKLFELINSIVEGFYSITCNPMTDNIDRKTLAKNTVVNSASVKEIWDDLLSPVSGFLPIDKRTLLFSKLVESFLTLRGKALSNFHKNKHQISKRMILTSKASLRKELKKKAELKMSS